MMGKISKMTFHKWLTRKPEFDCECIVITESFDSFGAYLIVKISDNDGWYWGWCDLDFNEIGDLAHMDENVYYLIPLSPVYTIKHK